MNESLHIERDELERRNQNRKPKMKIEIKFTDGTSRTIGGANDIATCLDYDLGRNWVESNGLVWAAEDAEGHEDDSSAEILIDGVRTSIDNLPI
jgi:hypothetical protein